MSLPIDRTAKSTLDTNLVNGNTSDAPAVKASNDVVYNTIDELYNSFNTTLYGVYNSDKFTQLGIINVKDSAFKASGSAQTTTGSITLGTATLNVASVIDFVVGQGVSVAGAGAAGAALITTISLISGTSLTLATNASTTVTGALIGHDDTTAIQSAINAATNKILIIPNGTYNLSSQLVISNPMILNNFGTIKINSTGTNGTPIISITSSNVYIYGNGQGMLDGNSNLWSGISATNANTVIENIVVDGMRFQNVGINGNLTFVISFASVKTGRMTNNWLKNCGVIGNVLGGGFGLYTQYSQNIIIENNTLEKVGSTGINSSASIDTIIRKNRLLKTTLFGIKGGYGLPAETPTVDITPANIGGVEVETLTITSAATASSNVTVTLDGTSYTVAVVSGDAASGVATKIRAATFTGWTTGGSGANVTFTYNINTIAKTPAYSAGTTGATGTISTTTPGIRDGTQFSIAKNSNSTKQWKVGTAFLIILSNTTKTVGVVTSIIDNGTYYTITSTKMLSLPVVGKSIEIYEMGLSVEDNHSDLTGENTVDLNVIKNVSIMNNQFSNCGWYQEAGTYAGSRTGIWVGADPQANGTITCFENYNVKIEGNLIENTYNSGIQVFSSNEVSIATNIVKDYNQINNATQGGIEVGRLGYLRCNEVAINDNICNSANGYGVLLSYFFNGIVSKNMIRSSRGIKLSASVIGLVTGNIVESLDNNQYALLISDDTGANATSVVNVTGNSLRCDGTNTIGINITDAGATGIVISQDCYVSATTKVSDSSTAKASYESYAIGVGTKVVAALYESAHRAYANSVPVAATVTIAQFNADNGTGGKVVIEGIARDGTTNVEDFTLRARGGYLQTNTVTFTSLAAPRGVAFLAAGDFTIVANGTLGLMDIKYTNNRANTVYLNLDIISISRF